jgi:hypothetical protein
VLLLTRASMSCPCYWLTSAAAWQQQQQQQKTSDPSWQQ